MGDGIKKVERAAFAYCSSLEKITLANESEIGVNAFYHAVWILSISFIPAYTFYNLTLVKSGFIL